MKPGLEDNFTVADSKLSIQKLMGSSLALYPCFHESLNPPKAKWLPLKEWVWRKKSP